MYTESIDSVYIENGTETIADYTMNIQAIPNEGIDGWGAFWALAQCAFYRDAPWLLKPVFYFYTDDINNAMQREGNAKTIYQTNDSKYYQSLKDIGLEVDDYSDRGAFRFIHLRGSHPPFVMNEDAKWVGSEKSSYNQQTIGCFKIIGEYIRQMKDLGVYDTATIVVTSDHGDWTDEEAAAPFILAKPSENAEEAAQPCEFSGVPTGHEDFAATIVSATGADYSQYGETFFEIDSNHRARKYIVTKEDGKRDLELLEYQIDGYVGDFRNWTLTGQTWVIPPSKYYN